MRCATRFAPSHLHLDGLTEPRQELALGRQAYQEILSQARLLPPNSPEVRRVARVGTGPPLILLHGYPDNLQIWCDLVPRLAGVRQVIAFDWPGMGRSDNWPGGASNVGTAIVAHAPPDGYTLLVVTTTNAINTSLYDNLDFDLIRDIAPVAGLVRLGLVIVVHPSVPAQTLPEFVAYAKANPGKINYASVGSGAATNVAGELFKEMAGVNLVNVPYRGSYLPDLLSGQVQASFTPILQSLSYINAGKLRALAVTGATRSQSLPDVPAAAEFVPGYEAYVWDAVGAPAKTPAEIIEQLNKEINAVLSDPAIKAQFAGLGAEPMLMTPAEFGTYIASEIEKWGKVVKTARIKVD